MITDDLCRSFFDLYHRLDPVTAAALDPQAEGRAVLVGLSGDQVREHVAALRSLGSAVEELAIDELDDEVDRTLLLGAIRSVEHRFDRGGPYRDNPAFWAHHLCRVVSIGPGDSALLESIPRFVQTARATLAKPALERLDLALALTREARAILAAGESQHAGDAIGPAIGAVDELTHFLAEELAPDSRSITLGSSAVEWTLHYEAGVEGDAAAALKRLSRLCHSLEEELDARAAALGMAGSWRDQIREAPAPTDWSEALDRSTRHAHQTGVGVDGVRLAIRAAKPFEALTTDVASIALEQGGSLAEPRIDLAFHDLLGADSTVVAARYGAVGASGAMAARRRSRSQVRQRYLAPSWLEGWCLFADETLDRDGFHRESLSGLRALADRYFAALVGVIDLGLALGQMTQGDAVRRLTDRHPAPVDRAQAAVRRIALQPLDALATVLIWQEWSRLAAGWPGEPLDFIRQVLEGGVLHPITAAWRLRIDG